MEKFQSLSPNCLLFDLAARLGSSEGYLYAEEKIDPRYLPNWLANVDREFQCLSPQVQNEIQPAYVELLNKVLALLRRQYGDQDANTAKVRAILGEVAK